MRIKGFVDIVLVVFRIDWCSFFVFWYRDFIEFDEINGYVFVGVGIVWECCVVIWFGSEFRFCSYQGFDDFWYIVCWVRCDIVLRFLFDLVVGLVVVGFCIGVSVGEGDVVRKEFG